VYQSPIDLIVDPPLPIRYSLQIIYERLGGRPGAEEF